MSFDDVFAFLIFLLFIVVPSLGRLAGRRQQRQPGEPRTWQQRRVPPATPPPVWPPPPPERAARRRLAPEAARPPLAPAQAEDWTREGGDQTPELIARHAESLGSDIALEIRDIEEEARGFTERATRLGQLRFRRPGLGPGLETELETEPPVADAAEPRAAGALAFTRDELRRGIILAEILAPPRSRRRVLKRR